LPQKKGATLLRKIDTGLSWKKEDHNKCFSYGKGGDAGARTTLQAPGRREGKK